MHTASTSPAYTRGPWFIGKKCPLGSDDVTREEFYIYSEKGNIATIPTDLVLHVNHDAEANARLISAAPELVEACRMFYLVLAEGKLQNETERQEFLVQVQEAIAKAGGR